MKILLTGSSGQIGWELRRSLSVLGDVVACERAHLDLSQPGAVSSVIANIAPHVIVNAAAYTAVDRAEQESELAAAINGHSVKALAEAARACQALFIHYSTDYVFDGAKQTPYRESDEPNPQSVYGATKLLGERSLVDVGGDWLVFRTSWVYGSHGSNFLKTILKLACERDLLKVVADQHGTPTSARMIADITSHVIRHAMAERVSGRFISGLYHLTAEGATTWHAFASAIVDSARELANEGVSKVRVEPIPSSGYPTPARRPLWSILDNGRFDTRFGLRRPHWREAMLDVLGELYDVDDFKGAKKSGQRDSRLI